MAFSVNKATQSAVAKLFFITACSRANTHQTSQSRELCHWDVSASLLYIHTQLLHCYSYNSFLSQPPLLLGRERLLLAFSRHLAPASLGIFIQSADNIVKQATPGHIDPYVLHLRKKGYPKFYSEFLTT